MYVACLFAVHMGKLCSCLNCHPSNFALHCTMDTTAYTTWLPTPSSCTLQLLPITLQHPLLAYAGLRRQALQQIVVH
jgi:hypothetical protein